jgi:Tfp pilus assembly pilus retraction ATPase PilT
MGALHLDASPRRGPFAVTFYRRNGHTEMSLRFCGHRIASREELGLPENIDDLARRPNGLVLVTGPTGAGKTTTLNYLGRSHQQRAPLQDRHHRRPDRICA